MFNRKEYISCHLEIDSSLHADAGQYKVTLENKLGAASATINVKVIGTRLHTSTFDIFTSTSVSWFLTRLCLLSSGIPGPCKEILASEITKSSCKVSWDPPDYDGGSPIIHYVLQVRDGGMVYFCDDGFKSDIGARKTPLGLKKG